MMKRIDTDAISSRPEDRLRFLEDFVGFTDDDWAAIRESVEVLVPHLPALLDALYEHLLSFDDTRRLFAVGDEVDLLYLAVRKQHLLGWVRATVAAGPDTRREFANYLNVIGRRHTGVAGDPRRVVPPRYMVGLVSFAQTAFARVLHGALADEPERALRMSLAWSKMLMMQLEMFLKNIAPQWPNWDEPRICSGEEYPHDAPTARFA
jgi:protoglobin